MENKLQKDLVQAMKDKDAIKLETIREIKTAITYFKAAPNYKGECTDADVLGIIQKVYKQHIETRDAAIQNKRSEMMYKEQNIIDVLEEYLPKLLPNDDVEAMITNFINENSLKGMQNMKVVMNYLKETIPNQYDNQFAVRCIREKLV